MQDVEASCYRHIYMDKTNETGELIFNEEENQALYEMVEICRADNAPLF